MNLIWICADTFRNDHVGRMGNDWIQTPNLDRLADDGVIFECAYAEGLPTGPERQVFMTGKFSLPWRGWTPLIPEDVTMAEHLQSHGYRTALFSDCYHMFKPNCNYHRGFDEFHWIRGQEQDRYRSSNDAPNASEFLPERTESIPAKHKKGNFATDSPRHPLRQYLRNIAERNDDDEADYFPGQTCGGAMKWLEDNAGPEANDPADNFLLWIEMFDPHEPYDPPQKYYDLYRDPAYTGPKILAPWFHSTLAKDFTEQELDHIRALYAGEVSLVDTWIGKLMDKVDALGLREETVIVFVSDHGTLNGERGYVGKNPTIGSGMSRHVCNQPLIIRNPKGPSGARVGDLVWSPDYMPTCCEMLGVDPPDVVHGRSFWGLVTDDDKSLARDHIISGKHATDGYYYVVDEKWSCLPKSPKTGDELYDRASDPEETTNLAAEHPDVVAAMHERVKAHLSLANTLHM